MKFNEAERTFAFQSKHFIPIFSQFIFISIINPTISFVCVLCNPNKLVSLNTLLLLMYGNMRSIHKKEKFMNKTNIFQTKACIQFIELYIHCGIRSMVALQSTPNILQK